MSSEKSLSVTPYTDHWGLLDSLLKSLADRRRDLVPMRLVVPSVHFRDWLQVQIAKRLGICMGLEFSMPQDFVVEVFRMKSSIIFN